MSGWPTDRLRSAARRFLLGSGPLKRSSDRVQVAGRLVVVLSLLAAIPLAVVAAGLTRSRLDAVAAAQSADRHAIRAVVLTGTTPSPWGEGSASVSIVRADIGWHAPDGADRHANLLVPAGTSPGSPVPVWIDARGDLSTAPMDQAAVGSNALAMGVAVAFGIPLSVVGLHGALCVVLNAHRRRRWGRDWARVERQWRALLG